MPPQPPFMETTDRGSFWDDVTEPGSGEVNRLLFPVPAEVLALVPPPQVFGINLHQLADAPHAVQMAVMRTWFMANFQPGAVDNPNQISGRRWQSVSARLERYFFDMRVERPFAAVADLARSLEEEAVLWVIRAREPSAVQQNALRALQELSDKVGPVAPAPSSIGHNSRKGGLLDDGATLDEARQAAQEIIAQAVAQVSKANPDKTVIELCARWLLSFAKFAASAIATDALQSGPDGAFSHLVILAHKAAEAVHALQALASVLI
jgi:hypothetical protein